MMDASWPYCGNPFTIHVNEAIMFYDLNSYNDVCQHNTGKKKGL